MKELKGQFGEKWGKLTRDDLDMVAGQRDQLIGRLEVGYGRAKEQVAKEADEFVKSLADKPKAAGHR